MSFKYTAAALAASSLLVNAAPAPRPSEQHQQPNNNVARQWDPSYFGYGYGYNPYSNYAAKATPQAENYWGPGGFDGEAWNNDHRTRPYPNIGYESDYYRRSADDAEKRPPRGGSVLGDDDDGDDDTTVVLLNPFNLLGGLLPLPNLGSFIGDLFGYPGDAAPRRPQPRPQGYPGPGGFPQGFSPGFPLGYPQGQGYPQQGYPQQVYPQQGYPRPPFVPGQGPSPKGYPRPYPKGVAPGAPLFSNLPNGAGSVSLGLIGGDFSLQPIVGLPTPAPLPQGSPSGPFPKGWPPLVGGAPPAITPAPGAPGIIGALPGGEGSQSLGIIGTSFSLGGAAGAAPTPAAPIVSPLANGAGSADIGLLGGSFSLSPVAGLPSPAATPAPVAPNAGGIIAPLASSAGAASLGLLGAGFSLDGAAGAAPTPAPVAPAAGGIVAPLASSAGAASLGLMGAGFSLDNAAGAVPTPAAAIDPSLLTPAVSPVSSPPVVQASPSAAAANTDATLSGGSGGFELDGSALPSPASAAASPVAAAASPASLSQADAGVAGNAAAGLGGLSSSATIN